MSERCGASSLGASDAVIQRAMGLHPTHEQCRTGTMLATSGVYLQGLRVMAHFRTLHIEGFMVVQLSSSYIFQVIMRSGPSLPLLTADLM